MPARKRAREEDVVEDGLQVAKPTFLRQLRDMWQFASLMQYITLFGSAVRLDPDFDIDDLEHECLVPQPSEKLANIALTLLKSVSSHKPLTPDNFDEYTRRQFVMKAPDNNPYGTDEQPAKFAEFDIPTKISVLQQLAVWTWGNADRMRSLLDADDEEQLQWRMDPFGWDSQLRVYFVLHDRLYRRTDPSPPSAIVPKAKSKAKKAARGSRASKRRKVSAVDEEEEEEEEETVQEVEMPEEKEDDGMGGAKWECIAVTLDEYNAFLDPLRRSRNRDEKDLIVEITQQVLPELEKHAEALERKKAKERRELEALQKMATAKRSSRIAGRMEKQKEIDEAEEAERRKRDDLKMAHKEENRRLKMEEQRESRMMTREQRLKDREVKRILHEEELARLESRGSSEQGESTRMTERNRKAALEKTQRELEDLKDDDSWDFDCAICGVHGKNLDDGTHSIACEKCSVWQHSACHGIGEAEAESDDFHFVCATCRTPKTSSLKLRLSSSASPQNEKKRQVNGAAQATFILPSEASQPPASPRALHAMRSTILHTNGETYTARLPAHTTQSRCVTPHSSPPRGHFSNGPSPSKPPAYSNGLSPHRPRSRHFSPNLPSHHNPPLNYRPQPRSYSPAQARTPSLAATQGQTSIRFSPTASPGGHTNSYSPIFNQPSAAALSPTKSSPPPQQHRSLSPSQGQNPVRLSPVPSYPENGLLPLSYMPTPRPAPMAVIVSPIKRASPSSSPPLHSQSMQPPSHDFATPSINRGMYPEVMGSGAMSLNNGSTPMLSPSVNAAGEVYETPMKRSLSGGVPPGRIL